MRHGQPSNSHPGLPALPAAQVLGTPPLPSTLFVHEQTEEVKCAAHQQSQAKRDCKRNNSRSGPEERLGPANCQGREEADRLARVSCCSRQRYRSRMLVVPHWTSSTGVSITRPVGQMWPPRDLYLAHGGIDSPSTALPAAPFLLRLREGEMGSLRRQGMLQGKGAREGRCCPGTERAPSLQPFISTAFAKASLGRPQLRC